MLICEELCRGVAYVYLLGVGRREVGPDVIAPSSTIRMGTAGEGIECYGLSTKKMPTIVWALVLVWYQIKSQPLRF